MRTNDLEAALTALQAFVDEQSQLWNPQKPPSELFHYTSPEGFLGIITSKTLWASDMLSLNDASEVHYPHRIITKILEEYADRMPAQHREPFIVQLKDYMFRLYTPFVTCFCEDGDLLSQWRGYGNEGEGFSLGLSVPWLISLEQYRFRLQRVIYDKAHQTDLVLMFIDIARGLLVGGNYSDEDLVTFWKGAAASLAPWVVMFKDPGFTEEREWRIVNVDQQNHMEFRRAGHRFVTYIRVPIGDSSAIVRVVRGPYFANAEVRGAELMLRKSGFIAASIQDSEIPLRR